MAKKINISNLFNINGCLNENAIAAYLAGKLEGKDLKQVTEHLDSCPLCSDAVEGASLAGPVKYMDDVNQLRTKINLQFKGKDKIHRLRNISFVAVAASILIIAGVFFLFNKLQYSQKENIAVTSPSEEEVLEKARALDEFEPKNEAPKPIASKKKENVISSLPPVKVETDQPKEYNEAVPEVPQIFIPQQYEELEEEKTAIPATSGMSSAQVAEPLPEGKIMSESTPKKSSNRRSILNETYADKEELSKQDKMPKAETLDKFKSEIPTFEGGGSEKFIKFIQDSLKNNMTFQQSGYTGDIIASFVVDTSGRIENINILNIADNKLHQELVRIFKNSPKWIPGMEKGIKVKTTYTVSIKTNP